MSEKVKYVFSEIHGNPFVNILDDVMRDFLYRTVGVQWIPNAHCKTDKKRPNCAENINVRRLSVYSLQEMSYDVKTSWQWDNKFTDTNHGFPVNNDGLTFLQSKALEYAALLEEDYIEENKDATDEEIKHAVALVISELNVDMHKFMVDVIVKLNEFDNLLNSGVDFPHPFNRAFHALKKYLGKYMYFPKESGIRRISDVSMRSSMRGRYIAISYDSYGVGDAIHKITEAISINEFDGSKSITELGIQVPTQEQIDAAIVTGQKVLEVASGAKYLNCSDHIYVPSFFGEKILKAKGRCVIDFAGLNLMNPNYSFPFDKYSDYGMAFEEASDDVKMCINDDLYGFSFTAKVWGKFKLDSLSEIAFRDDAYDNLVLDEDLKEMLFGLVEINGNSVGSDIVDGKGGGCIFMLNGPPGVGKTLTAESIAEKLHRPLYIVSVGELGTDPTTLEENLKSILEIASAWDAVLLIDEADIFMEQRNSEDIVRNAMVGIFLRLLEYYQGILFLTTNRANNIDRAFLSRISLALNYNDLSTNDRKVVWHNLSRINNIELSEFEITSLSTYGINGRQIKNAIRVASALAHRNNRKPTLNDFVQVIARIDKFSQGLKG